MLPSLYKNRHLVTGDHQSTLALFTMTRERLEENRERNSYQLVTDSLDPTQSAQSTFHETGLDNLSTSTPPRYSGLSPAPPSYSTLPAPPGYSRLSVPSLVLAMERPRSSSPVLHPHSSAANHMANSVLSAQQQSLPSSVSVGEAYMNEGNELTGDYDVQDALLSHEPFLPDLQQFYASNPRPFSSSDMSSLYPQPQNTPVNSFMMPRRNNVHEIETMRDEDFYQDQHHGDQDRSFTTNNSLSLLSRAPSDSRATALRAPADLGTVRMQSFASHLLPVPRMSISNNTNNSLIGPSGRAVSVQQLTKPERAALILSRAAQDLTYDLMYVVSISAINENLTLGGIAEPANFCLQWKAAYGLGKVYPTQLFMIKLNKGQHIKALQPSPRPPIYPGLVQVGADQELLGTFVLIGIALDGGDKQVRTRGTILGAWRHGINPDQIVEEDIASLEKVFTSLWPLIREDRVSETPSQTRYPANEATELEL